MAKVRAKGSSDTAQDKGEHLDKDAISVCRSHSLKHDVDTDILGQHIHLGEALLKIRKKESRQSLEVKHAEVTCLLNLLIS